jgi:formylglycine-generating enzyme required for sulfatase activity/dienelactone hydrolase
MLAPGTRLGRYDIRSLLGSGGMGDVYLAFDRDLEREIAIKVLHTSDNPDRARRFVQEAKAASALHHPNVAHVYEIGSQDDVQFIAMEVVEGQTLREHIGRGILPAAEAIEIAKQIAAALGAAHKHGVVHRDIKPENVIVSSDGHAKVLDFGLAKLREMRDDAATLVMTKPGTTLGTLPYMAPEQIGGGDVHPSADVFSLGVVMYEMLTGRRPFTGANASEIVAAILTRTPEPLRDVPRALESIINKSLAKNPKDRYPSASELLEDLKRVGAPSARVNRKPLIAFAAVLVIAVITVLAFVSVARKRRTRMANAEIATAQRLVGERKLAEAFDHVSAAAEALPNDDRVRDLLYRTSDRLKVESEPSGAKVSAIRFKGSPERIVLGTTPFTIPRIARADYVFTFEKSGYATASGSVSLSPRYVLGEAFITEMPPLRVKLVESSKVPAGMVLVPGGEYRLASSYRPSERRVALSDFFIDRVEVSNRDFEQFIRDGGYRRRELWKHPFVDQGKAIPFEEGIARFHDSTGLPGPRGWSGGAPPPGRENHPVTGVTWFEAAAFAEWKGRSLPTIYQWEKTSRYAGEGQALNSYPWGVLSEGTDVNERANFLGEDTMPVDSMPFGVAPSGALNMAGNVSEWCRNEDPPGYAARGGSFKDNAYAFGQTAAFPGFYAAPTLGFRCVAGGAGDEGDFALNPKGFVPDFKPVDDRTFEEYRRRYEYANTPLDARVIERADAADWTRETIEYTAGSQRVKAYLYLPKSFKRPLQAIHFAPAGDVTEGFRTLTHSIEMNLGPLIRGGRAVFAVQLEGYIGRPLPRGWTPPDVQTDEYVDTFVRRVTETRRGLDYLVSRPDIDRTRIALLGVSAGGGAGIFVSALDARYRAVIFMGTGISQRQARYAAAANRVNFVPQIKAPVFMLQGKYDEDTSWKSEAEPLYRLLRAPKVMEVFEGSHIPRPEVSIPMYTKWLDQTLGKP